MEKGEDEDNDVPDEPPPFQNEVGYVIQTWLEHKLHHTYPEQGGYNDQNLSLVDDWHIMNMYYVRILKGVSSALVMPEHGPSWLDGLENE